MSKRLSRLDTFVLIFKHPTYILSTLLSSALFYYIFYKTITLSNKGVFLVFVPIYFVYLLVLLSGISFSISLYTIFRSVLTGAARLGTGITGILLPSLGGLVASCGCSFSILASLLVFLGINTFDAVGLISSINAYQAWIIGILILVDFTMIYIYLGKISNFFRKMK